MPDVAPLAEQGLPAYDVKTWYGLFVPARTPKAIIDRLHGEISKIAAARDFRERLAGLGGEAVAIGPDPFKEQVSRELKIWEKTIKDANIRIE